MVSAGEQQSDETRPARWPGISVVVPVYNDPGNLRASLEAIRRSDYPLFEVIVVDDASTDDTHEVALELGARTLRLETQSGPAVARNRGAQHARHPFLFFIDADVRVEPDTLRRAIEIFLRDSSIDALFGSYDQAPGAPNLLSQYRNLLHHHVHQKSNEEAFTFWSGCGAIKRSVFLEMGGFDVGYGKASIEDIELGSRLRRAGHRVVLAKNLQVQHLKRWSLWSMIRCDILQRGIPWTLLLLREGKLPDDLNLQRKARLSTLLSLALVLMLLAGSWYFRSLLLLPLVVVLTLLVVDRWSESRPIHRVRGIALTLAVVATGTAMFVTTAQGHNLSQLWLFLVAVFLAAIILLNIDFYFLFVRIRKPHWLPLVIPLHILFYLYSGLSFAIGSMLHFGRMARQKLRPRLEEE